MYLKFKYSNFKEELMKTFYLTPVLPKITKPSFYFSDFVMINNVNFRRKVREKEMTDGGKFVNISIKLKV